MIVRGKKMNEQPDPEAMRYTGSVRIGPEVYRQAKIVAAHKGVSLADYLNEKLTKGGTSVSEDYRQVCAELSKDAS